MKYQVQIKYTNPSHEHVSFRRRVESVTRLVEASSETEALNRAANQQRALGYMIKEATVMKPEADDKSEYKQKKKKKVVDDNENTEISVENGDIKEGFDTDPKDIAAYLVDRHGKGKVTMDHIEAYERRRDSNRPIEKDEVMKHVKKMSEEVEQIDEGKAHDRITAGLKDKNRDVRVNAILHPKATPEHISIALKDEHPEVREAAVRHRNATSEHISAGLKDDDMIVRKAAIKNRNATSEHISAALKDGDIYTRMNAIKHRNVSPENIAIALKDKESYVRDAAKKRMKKEEVFTEEESIEEAKQVDHAKTIANSLAATHPNFRVSSYNGDHGRAHVVHHKLDTRNFKNGEELMGPNIQLQHNHKTNKVHMEMQGDFDNVPDRDEETHHPDKAHEAAHKMFKPAIDLIHKTDKTTTNEETKFEEAKDVTKDLRTSMKMMDLRHGVDADKRDKGYKMSATVRAAQKKFDAQSKGQGKMRPQAGTLAALRKEEVEEIQYIEEKLSASDPASKWISDFVASDNPKFAGKSKKERINMALGAYYSAKKMKNEEVELDEAADPGKHRVVNKKVEVKAAADTKKSEKKLKTAEKVMQIAKNKKNPVNLEPVLASNKVNNA